MKVKIFANTKCELGEGLHWNSKRQSLFWVDILCNLLFEKKENEELKSYFMPCMVTATLEHQNESFLYLVTEIGIATFDLDRNYFKCIVPFDLATSSLFRTNDAGVDPDGNIFFGTMKRILDQGSGSLYKVEKDKKIKKVLDNIGIPNTIRWYNDKFYIADSYAQEMYQFDLSQSNIIEKSKKLLFSLKSSQATPDGSAISTDGLLWNAQWDGFCITAYDRFANNVQTINLPVPRPTSCTFGGVDNQCLFITTARTGLSAGQLKKYPESGAIFMIKLDHSGCKSIIPNI
jgi:sugar lactone lactonase YvrE